MAGINSVSSCWLQRQIAKALVLVLVAPLAHASAAPQASQDQSAQTQQQTTPAAKTNTGQPALPNAPQNHSQNTGAQSAPSQQTQVPAPVGTAAAPAETPVGTAVSRPAGAAIAPAKQKRRHIFLIRMGLVVGAAVAVGTVVALSKASRSRP